MNRARSVGVSGGLLCFLVFCSVSFFALPLFAGDDLSGGGSVSHAKDGEGDATGEEPKQKMFDKLAAKIMEDRTVDPNVQVDLMAKDLEKINAEQKALEKEAISVGEHPMDSGAYDQDVVKMKLGLGERKKQLIERKVAFFQAKILSQNSSHAKIQFFLTNVFSDSASFFVITKQLKELERRRAQRLSEKRQLSHEIEVLSSRIRIEAEYLSAKKVLLAASRDKERSGIQETVKVAEERLKVFQDTQAFLEEERTFADFRVATLQDFDQLIRLRRREVMKERIFSKNALPYSPFEVACSCALLFLLGGGFLFRKRFERAVLSLPSFLSREGILVCTRAVWVLGVMALFAWGGLDLLGFRAAAIFLGLVYLSISLGLLLFVIAKGLIESLFMSVLQRIAKATQTEIKQSSSVFLLVRTVLMWGIFGGIFYQILDYWALEGEVTRWLLGVVNEPFF